MAVELGVGFVQIVPSAKGIAAGIARELLPVEGAATKSGATAGKNLSAGLLGSLFNAKTALKIGPLLGFATLGAIALKSAATVDDANNIILRSTGATGKKADSLLASFKKIGAETPASLATTATAIAEVYQRTGLTGKALETLALQVVTFNRITKDSPIGVQDLTKALAAFNVPGDQAGKVLDQLFNVSRKTGVPLAELIADIQQGGPSLRGFGFDIATSAGLMAQLNKAGIDATPVLFALRKAFVEFAKEGKDPRQQLGLLLGQMDAFIAKGDKLAAEQIAVKVFGARGVGLVDAVVQGKLSLDDLNKSFDTTGKGILATAAKTPTLSAQLGKLKNEATLALAEFGKPTLEIFTTALKAGLPILKDIADAFTSLPKPVQTGLIALIGFGAAWAPITRVAGGIADLATSIASVATRSAPMLISALASMPAAFGPVGLALAGLGAAFYIAFSTTPVNNMEVALDGESAKLSEIINKQKTVMSLATVSWVQDYLRRKGSLGEFNKVLADNKITLSQVVDALGGASDGTGQWIDKLGLSQQGVFDLEHAMGGLDVAFRKGQGSALDAAQATGDFATIAGLFSQGMYEAVANFDSFKKTAHGALPTIDQLKSDFGDAAKAAEGHASAVLASTHNTQDAANVITIYRGQLAQQLVALGYNTDQANSLAAAIINIPGSHNSDVTVDASQANAALLTFLANWNQLPTSKKIDIYINQTGQLPTPAQLGKPPGAASGTSFSDGYWGWVGEQGRELVHLDGPGQVFDHSESMRMVRQLADVGARSSSSLGGLAPGAAPFVYAPVTTIKGNGDDYLHRKVASHVDEDHRKFAQWLRSHRGEG